MTPNNTSLCWAAFCSSSVINHEQFYSLLHVHVDLFYLYAIYFAVTSGKNVMKSGADCSFRDVPLNETICKTKNYLGSNYTTCSRFCNTDGCNSPLELPQQEI